MEFDSKMRGDLNGKNVITAPHGVRVQDVKALERERLE
jgi:hypothetical protein